MANKTMGDRIAEAREERGFSPSELARLTKVSPTAVWNWENNGTKPRAVVFALIAKSLGVTESWLSTGVTASASKQLKVPEILSTAEAAIAGVLGCPLDRVKLRLEVTA